jgi:hypothetical protein
MDTQVTHVMISTVGCQMYSHTCVQFYFDWPITNLYLSFNKDDWIVSTDHGRIYMALYCDAEFRVAQCQRWSGVGGAGAGGRQLLRTKTGV